MASEDDRCPLCCEEYDQQDKNFMPCKCGYRPCLWCWHHIKDNLNGLCPQCRTPYSDEPFAFSPVEMGAAVREQRAEQRRQEKQREPRADTVIVPRRAASYHLPTLWLKLGFLDLMKN